jgi:4-hydroxyacetophenone monooxygenase
LAPPISGRTVEKNKRQEEGMDGDLALKPKAVDLTAALEDAHIPTLVPALVLLTGDTAWLDGEAPVYIPVADDAQGGLSPQFQAKVRAAAKAAFDKRAAGEPLPPPPSPDTVRRMMDYVAGQPIPERYAPFLMEELGLDGIDAKRPHWQSPKLRAAAATMKVTIVGAGMSGLLTAIRLQQAGIGFEIVEKNPDVGGTWLENIYPGCRVDSPNHMYSYSFEPNHEWPQLYSTQDVLLSYFQRTADKHGLRPHIRFETTVVETRFDETQGLWRTKVRDKDGREEEIVSNAVVSAVGQLNQPKLPDIAGIDRFKGTWFHSARWDKTFDPAGKTIAVIGTGASAFQFVPKIAPLAKHLTVFQRTPPWLGPTANYHEDVAAGKKALLEHLPFYDKWYRFYLFWTMTDGLYDMVKADEGWTGPPTAVGEANAMLRALLVEQIRPQTVGREDLFDKVVPVYPFGGKRSLRDNGVWIEALKRDNVDLVTTPIKEVTEAGIETEDGKLHAVDAVIYGTGFHASDFLKTFEIYGKGGVALQDQWDGDARAYLGMTMPNFPNFFALYGPNTNIVVNGSIIFFSECSVRYIIGALELLVETGAKTLEVKESVHDAFNAKVDAANAKMAWGAPQVSSWYKNEKGRVSQNWPFPLVDYWEATLKPNAADFVLR